jgi:hypothetical protein
MSTLLFFGAHLVHQNFQRTACRCAVNDDQGLPPGDWCSLVESPHGDRVLLSMLPHHNCIGNLDHLFFWPEVYRRIDEMSIAFVFDENPGFALAGSGGAIEARTEAG